MSEARSAAAPSTTIEERRVAAMAAFLGGDAPPSSSYDPPPTTSVARSSAGSLVERLNKPTQASIERFAATPRRRAPVLKRGPPSAAPDPPITQSPLARPGAYLGTGTWRAPPPPPDYATKPLVRSSTAAKGVQEQASTSGTSMQRSASAPGIQGGHQKGVGAITRMVANEMAARRSPPKLPPSATPPEPWSVKTPPSKRKPPFVIAASSMVAREVREQIQRDEARELAKKRETPIWRRAPPKLPTSQSLSSVTDPQKHKVLRRVVFGSRAWLINNQRWPGWPKAKFSVTGAPSPWPLDYHAELSHSSTYVTGKEIDAVGVGKDVLSDCEDQVKRHIAAGGAVPMEDRNDGSVQVSRGKHLVLRQKPPPGGITAWSKTPDAAPAPAADGDDSLHGSNSIDGNITGQAFWIARSLETPAVRKMLQAAREELRQQRLESWSEELAGVPSLSILVEIKYHSPEAGEHSGFRGFSFAHDATKYQGAFEGLQNAFGDAIFPPEDMPEAPPIPVTVGRINASRERFEPTNHHVYPRYGSDQQLEAIMAINAESGTRPCLKNPVPEVKTDYQLPDNLPFSGPYLLSRRQGIEAPRIGACEVYLVTCQDEPSSDSFNPAPCEEKQAALPKLQPYYSLHSKLWTRRFPNPENVLRRCREYLQPVFQQREADAVLVRLLQRTEELHASDDEKLTGEPDEMERQAASMGVAAEELEAAISKHVARASPSVAAWAYKALDALRGLHTVMESASRAFSARTLSADLAFGSYPEEGE